MSTRATCQSCGFPSDRPGDHCTRCKNSPNVQQDALIELLTDFGLKHWHTGGGCMAWVKDYDNGRRMMVTDTNGTVAPDIAHMKEPIWVGFDNQDSSDDDSVVEWDTFADLVYALTQGAYKEDHHPEEFKLFFKEPT